MTTSPSPYATAYRAARSSLGEAPTWSDPDLSIPALIRRRAELIRIARSQLVAAIPKVPAATRTPADVLASRAPKTADQVAVFARERQKVAALAAAGKQFEDIVATASELRIDALADDLETLAASDAEEGERVAGLLFGRLVELGAQDAVTADQEQREGALATAWHEALTATAENREVELGTRTQLFNIDPEGYAAAFVNDVAVDWTAVARAESVA